MNEFTKEELNKIQNALIFSGTIEQDMDFNLSEKIQSMIDNYCEHDYVYSQVQIAKKTYECVNCGKVTNDNQ